MKGVFLEYVVEYSFKESPLDVAARVDSIYYPGLCKVASDQQRLFAFWSSPACFSSAFWDWTTFAEEHASMASPVWRIRMFVQV